MAIPDRIIDEIQAKVDIVEVISRYVPLKKTGRNYKAPCPFHQEKTPSFIVSQDKQIYHCFGCGAGGNVFSFLMRQEGVQFPEAVEMLAEKAGVALPRGPANAREDTSLNNRLYAVNEEACRYFQACLAQNGRAREYLNSRGIAEGTIKKFRIGYSADSWDRLLNHMKGKGHNAQLLETGGLVVANEKGGHYDRFRDRVIFPIIDTKDRILGFGGRVLDSSQPKYINSPETPIYVKGRHLYGLNLSRESIRSKRHALLVEGYLDFIIPYQAGIENMLATLGTALTPDQVRTIKRFADTVIMAYDPDSAGESASLRGLDLFLSADVNVYIAELPKGYDPDGYIRKFGAEDFLMLVKSSRNIFEYKLDKLKQRYDPSTTHGKAGIVGEMLPTIAKVNNAVSQADLMKKLAERLAVDEDAVKAEMKKLKAAVRTEKPLPQVPAPARNRPPRAEMTVLAIILDGGEFIARTRQALSPEEFRDAAVKRIVSEIFDMHDRKDAVAPVKLINRSGNSEEVSRLISEAVGILDTLADKERALEDCIRRIKDDNAGERLEKLREAIKAAHGEKDEDRERTLVAEYNSLVRNRHGI